MDVHWKAAEKQLQQIGWRQLAITADRLYTRQPFAKVYLPTITGEIAAAHKLLRNWARGSSLLQSHNT